MVTIQDLPMVHLAIVNSYDDVADEVLGVFAKAENAWAFCRKHYLAELAEDGDPTPISVAEAVRRRCSTPTSLEKALYRVEELPLRDCEGLP